MPDSTSSRLMKNIAALDRIQGITPAQIAALNAYWIISIQEFLAASEIPNGRGYLLDVLGIDDAGLDRLLKRATDVVGNMRGDDREQEVMEAVFPTGALELPEAERAGETYDTITFAGELPAFVDYTGMLPPPRNQGSRGTCVAHASAALRELMEIQAGMATAKDINLSEQFIYWWCKNKDGIPSADGTYPHLGVECLAQMGTVTEERWSYNDQRQTPDDSQGPPPAGALDEAWRWRLKRMIRLDPHDVKGIKTALAAGKPVAFAIPVFSSWYYSRVTRRVGKINPPFPGERANGAHALCLVGYVDDDQAPGGGYFLLRNSWGSWGYDNPQAAGCGAIPYAFLATHNMTASTGDRASLADVYIRDNDKDKGEVPSVGVRCNSPDIWVRHEADGLEGHQMPRSAAPNTIYVRAWNQGPATARNVTATLYQAPASPSIWPANWRKIGDVAFPDIPVQGSATTALDWTAPDAGPFCFLARLSSPDDPVQHEWSVRDDNNIAQKNCILLSLQAGAAASFSFRMHGLPNQTTLMDLDIDRRAFPRGRIELRMAERTGYRRLAQLQEDESRLANLVVQATDSEEVSVAITADAKAAAGQKGEIVFTQHHGNLLVGRLVVQVQIV